MRFWRPQVPRGTGLFPLVWGWVLGEDSENTNGSLQATDWVFKSQVHIHDGNASASGSSQQMSGCLAGPKVTMLFVDVPFTPQDGIIHLAIHLLSQHLPSACHCPWCRSRVMNKLGSFCSQGAHNLAGKMHEEKSHIIKHIIKEKYSGKEHSVLAAGGTVIFHWSQSPQNHPCHTGKCIFISSPQN